MEKKLRHTFVLSLIFLSNISLADYWTQKASFPLQGRSGMFSFSIGTQGYMGCGYQGGNIYNDFWQYDQASDTWTQKANFGGSICWYPAGFAINGKGYAGLGYYNGTMYPDFWEYDPSLNQWTQKNNFPVALRFVPLSLASATKGYILGGSNVNGYLKELYEYDPVTDTWTQLMDLPGAGRLSPAGFIIGNKLYAGTGEAGATLLNDFWSYDIPNNSWTQMATFPGTNRANAAAFCIGDKGYLGIGEIIPFGTFVNDWWEYDTTANSWTAKTNYGSAPTAETINFAIGNKGYVGCGENYNAQFWEYCPDAFCATALPVSAFSADQDFCPGTCINFTNQSLNAISYNWSFPGATPSTSTDVDPQNVCYSQSGNYDVQLISTNAGGSDTLLMSGYITVFPAPAPQSITQSGDTLFALSGAAAYQWYYNGNLISGATNANYVATQNGDYNLVATDSNGCEVEAVIFDVMTEINFADNSFGGMRLFPNPVTDYLNMYNFRSPDECTISIYNVTGEKVKVENAGPVNHPEVYSIDCSLLHAGVYTIEISSKEKQYRKTFIRCDRE